MLVLLQSSLQIYELTVATQKLATFIYIIQVLHQDIFKTYIMFDHRTLLAFVKIMQSFILMQNT